MMPVFVFRERIRVLYQKYDIYIMPALKFIFAFIVFQVINGAIGYDARIRRFPIVFILSLLSAFTPSAIMVLLAAVVCVLHVYSVSNILSVIIILIMLILYLLFARFTPRLGFVVLAVPILFVLKIPYMIPILMGLIATPMAIIPTGCGVVIYYLLQIIKEAATNHVNINPEEVVQLYTYVIDSLITNKQMIITIVIFSLIILITFFIRKMKFDYAFEISIAAGALTCILGFLISDFVLDISNQIIIMILGSIGSTLIVYVVHFFKLTLDYSGVEIVQFEDDVYYYYVKAVPKITVTAPQMNVKRFNAQKSDSTHRSGIRRHDIDMDEEYEDAETDSYYDDRKGSHNNNKTSRDEDDGIDE